MAKNNYRHLSRFLDQGPFNLVDVGASGGTQKKWTDFLGQIKVIGFEPDEAEFKKLKSTDSEIWFPTALSSSNQPRKLNITKSQTNSSFLKPNQRLLSQLQWSPSEPIEDHLIVKELDVPCETLDRVLTENNLCADFIKIDTQGSELDILKGAANKLSEEILTVEVEVEFAPLYENQPLFADVDQYLRSKGFYLQDLGDFLSMKPRGLAGIGGAKGRLMSADALYIKDFSQDYSKIFDQGERKVQAAVLAYAAYGFPELAIQLLNKLEEQKCSIQNSKEIITSLKKIGPKKLGPFAINSLSKNFAKAWYQYRQPEHCLWDSPLGNELR